MPENHTDLESRIKNLAHEIGFDEVGITKPSSLVPGERAIKQWVAEGRHGSMKYLEDFGRRREKFFSDFPDAKSILVLGVNYFTGERKTSRTNPSEKTERFRGRVARYAWGRDYHVVIREKHERLMDRLKEILGPDFRAKSCVDTQPIPERFAAVQAGLGFLGKHTGLLRQRFGPWLFLSEIVTNLDLEEDLPARGDCGTCSDCQSVCPTGALDQDYKMDARRCIAYWTIEHKGVIPHEMRSKIRDWIFGCDECLMVCPFTSKQRESSWGEFEPGAGPGEWIDFRELFEISSNRVYEKKYRGTALLRANRKQMLRNACIVLGNSGREEAIPYLEKAIVDFSPLVRLHAAWALGELPFPKAEELLRNRILKESDPQVREEVVSALNRLQFHPPSGQKIPSIV